jgi:uncharacterized repeat protein (TIGR02543 family)
VAEDGLSLTTVTVEMGPATEDVVVTTPHGSALREGGFTFTNGTSTSTTTPPTSTTTYTLTYASGVNGSLTGSTTQIVASGGNGTAVTAVPNSGFQFSGWSDSGSANPRTDTNVTGNVTVTANFTAASSTPSDPSCNGSTFDSFNTGTVNNQGGWTCKRNRSDQEVVPNTFGYPIIRMQDASHFRRNHVSLHLQSGFLQWQLSHEAGETDAVSNLDTPPAARQPLRCGSFDLATVTDGEQPGMHLSVAPDREEMGHA